MLRRPQATFLDIINEWEAASTGENRDALLRKMLLREVQLLNLKANDQSEVFEGARIKPTHLPNATPPLFLEALPYAGGTAEGSRKPAEMDAPLRPTFGAAEVTVEPVPSDSSRPPADDAALYSTSGWLRKRPDPSFCQYSVAHFAAELGDLALLQFVAEQLADSVPFSPPDQEEPPGQTRQEQQVAFAWLVRHGYDFNGCALSHLAAAQGNVAVLQYLVEHFGAEIILNRQQRKRPNTPPKSVLWGADAHMEGLNAVGTAMLHGQTEVLRWLHAHYPSVIALMPPAELQHVLTAAALREDSANTFAFLAERGIIRAKDGVSASEAVSQNGLGPALVAASEAGHLHLLQWFMRTFGADVLMVAGNQGATPLHHCARGSRASVLRALLLGDSSLMLTSTVDVDVPDRRGRTPAMWCVLSNACKKKHMIDTLEVLRQAGSSWPSYRDFSGNTLLDVAQTNSSPFSMICQYLKRNVKSSVF
ncbi:hypothetical protein STCU_04626 [Strigomonas culicis]|uniref:Uncharacterized protein n=1 Tax=Strigomonas culicis TaxID=28005 RepID=S9UK39_9TRYP|nr:hypothetical protein STCU_04626 [Strigomonas culicis]|eukprot:EPY29298.1 hypothetical protein STCU_04626 [Strigomonas culicis]